MEPIDELAEALAARYGLKVERREPGWRRREVRREDGWGFAVTSEKGRLKVLALPPFDVAWQVRHKFWNDVPEITVSPTRALDAKLADIDRRLVKRYRIEWEVAVREHRRMRAQNKQDEAFRDELGTILGSNRGWNSTDKEEYHITYSAGTGKDYGEFITQRGKSRIEVRSVTPELALAIARTIADYHGAR